MSAAERTSKASIVGQANEERTSEWLSTYLWIILDHSAMVSYFALKERQMKYGNQVFPRVTKKHTQKIEV